MKTATKRELKTNTHAHNSKPFFNKKGGVPFFSNARNIEAPFFSPSIIQPKFMMGEPGDKYEQEADQSAGKVVQYQDLGHDRSGNSVLRSSSSHLVQTKRDSAVPMLQKEEKKVQKPKQTVSGKVAIRSFPGQGQAEIKGQVKFPLDQSASKGKATGTVDAKVGIKEPKEETDTPNFGGGSLGFEYKLHKRVKILMQLGLLYKDGNLLSSLTAGTKVNLGFIHPELSFLVLEAKGSHLYGKKGHKGDGEFGLRAKFDDDFALVGGITLNNDLKTKGFVQMEFVFEGL